MSKKLSIVTVTYNQEKILANTLDSLLSQQTNFDYEIVIGDDCSTDNTLQIIKEYKTKYPDKIRVITADVNMGLEKNYLRCYRTCKTEYVAICDGDDYWIDAHKIQKQVDFLERHPDYGLVGTMIDFYDETNDTFTPGKRITEDYVSYTIEDIIVENPLTSSAVLFRGYLLEELIALYDRNKKELDNFIDYSLWMYFASKLKVAELKDVATVYRLSNASISQNSDYAKRWAYRERNYRHFKFFIKYLDDLDKTVIKRATYNRALWYYKLAAVNGDIKVAEELQEVFKENKDSARIFFTKLILKYPKTLFLAEVYDKLRVRFSKK